MCSNACSHTFAWHAVIPPSHCPVCGACLGCGMRTAPIAPRPWPAPYYPPTLPWWQQGPYYETSVSIVNTTSNTAVAA